MKPPATGLPEHEARRLMQLALRTDAAGIAARSRLDPAEARRFRRLVERRQAGEPLQYIEGSVQFGPIDLVVDRRVLIPRPETEGLWELAAAFLAAGQPGATAVDLGTGSGNLALALKYASPAAEVFATDISRDALDVARLNAFRLGLEVTFLQGDLWEALPRRLRGRVDLLVSNPPYVAVGEDLPSEIRDYEPAVALYAGPDGDDILERIAAGALSWVAPGGAVYIEIGEGQGERATELFAGFECQVRADLAGRPRVLHGLRR